MPATLSEAYISPFHTYTSNSSSSDGLTTSSGSIRNPNYYESQNNYYVPTSPVDSLTHSKIDDIHSEADDIKSIYHTLNSTASGSDNGRKKKSKSLPSHDCDYLIARLLSCSKCRKKVRRLLTEDLDPPPPPTQRGGGNIFSDSLLTNIVIGVIILYIVDRIMARGLI